MPGIPRDIDFRLLDPRIVEGRTSPIISTAPGERDGTRAGDPVDPPYDPVGVIFSDSFDDQPDWTSAMYNPAGDGVQRAKDGDTIPQGWYSARTDPKWSPSRGYPGGHESIEIKAENSGRNAGKSFRCYRHATTPGWQFEGQIPVTAGQYVKVRHRASDSPLTDTTTTLFINGTPKEFTSTTTSLGGTHTGGTDANLDTEFSSRPNRGIGSIVESNPIQIAENSTLAITNGDLIISNNLSSWPDWKYWGSESMLLQHLPQGRDELYVEFWIQFSENWTRTALFPYPTSKLFRISSWSGDGSEYGAFSDGNIGPIALWDHEVSGYGVRNRLAFRGGPHSDNYGLGKDAVPDVGHLFVPGSVGDMSLNFTGHLATMGPGNTQPIIEDRVNGGFITKNSGTVWHDQIFGAGEAWTKVGIYVKMNSVVNATDGIFRQWMNGHRIFESTTIPWIRSSETRDENAKWNLIAIGGNDYFQCYCNYEMREEWYAIDDLVIRDSIPQELL